jgi:hypothetical protein
MEVMRACDELYAASPEWPMNTDYSVDFAPAEGAGHLLGAQNEREKAIWIKVAELDLCAFFRLRIISRNMSCCNAH